MRIVLANQVFVFLLVFFLILSLARLGRLCWLFLQHSHSQVEFTRFYGDPKYEGEPITYEEATGLRLRGAEGEGN